MCILQVLILFLVVAGCLVLARFVLSPVLKLSKSTSRQPQSLWGPIFVADLLALAASLGEVFAVSRAVTERLAARFWPFRTPAELQSQWSLQAITTSLLAIVGVLLWWQGTRWLNEARIQSSVRRLVFLTCLPPVYVLAFGPIPLLVLAAYLLPDASAAWVLLAVLVDFAVLFTLRQVMRWVAALAVDDQVFPPVRLSNQKEPPGNPSASLDAITDESHNGVSGNRTGECSLESTKVPDAE